MFGRIRFFLQEKAPRCPLPIGLRFENVVKYVTSGNLFLLVEKVLALRLLTYIEDSRLKN